MFKLALNVLFNYNHEDEKKIKCLKEPAIVIHTLEPLRSGLIQFQGRYLRAKCQLSITINGDELVEIIGAENGYYLVQPFKHFEIT